MGENTTYHSQTVVEPKVPVSAARQRRRHKMKSGAGHTTVDIKQYRPGYTWNRGGRMKEIRIRFVSPENFLSLQGSLNRLALHHMQKYFLLCYLSKHPLSLPDFITHISWLGKLCKIGIILFESCVDCILIIMRYMLCCIILVNQNIARQVYLK